MNRLKILLITSALIAGSSALASAQEPYKAGFAVQVRLNGNDGNKGSFFYAHGDGDDRASFNFHGDRDERKSVVERPPRNDLGDAEAGNEAPAPARSEIRSTHRFFP